MSNPVRVVNPLHFILQVAILSGMAHAQSNPPSFQGLGDLAGGACLSQAYGMSADGSVVAGQSDNGAPTGGLVAFRWASSSGMTALGLPPGWSSAIGISRDGTVIVGGATGSHGIAFKWTVAGGMVTLPPLAGLWPDAIATAASQDGSIVVGYTGITCCAPGNMQACAWSAGGGVTGLGQLPGTTHSWALDVSADGSVVVGTSMNMDESHGAAFRWTAATGMTSIGVGANFSSANAVSADGSVVVGWTGQVAGALTAYRWTANTGLQMLPITASWSNAYTLGAVKNMDVSDDGSVVVAHEGAGGATTAVIWDQAHGKRVIRDVLASQGINMGGWNLTKATSVSAAGTVICGIGTHGTCTEAWRAVIPPSDSDGDGLLDSWESQGGGIDFNGDGTIDLDLYAHGARPNHKDLFVEIDCMTGRTPTNLQAVVDAFDHAPVSNPDGASGIRLHLQVDDTTLPLSSGWSEPFTFTAVDNLKSGFFGTAAERGSSNSVNLLAAKRNAFRYCIYANTSDGYADGVARDYHANDFVIFKGMAALSNPINERAVFMHELGHALGLGHGGIEADGTADVINNKPNYISVMNYLFQLPFNAGSAWRLDYSHGTMLPVIESSIDENNFLVDLSGFNAGQLTYRPNAAALCPQTPCNPVPPAAVIAVGFLIGSAPRDIDGDGMLTAGLCMDLNYYGTNSPISAAGTPSPCEIMNDHNDWAALQYALVDETTDGGPPTNPPVELTVSEIQQLQVFLPSPPCLADIDGDETVDVDDLLIVITNWGPCPKLPSICHGDIAPLPVDGTINVNDLLAIITGWGPCPR